MTVPSRLWFPVALQDQAAWYQNFANQFGPLATTLGFLPAMVTAVNADRDDLVLCVVDGRSVSVRKGVSAVSEQSSKVPSVIRRPTSLPTRRLLRRLRLRPDFFSGWTSLLPASAHAPAYNHDIGPRLG